MRTLLPLSRQELQRIPVQDRHRAILFLEAVLLHRAVLNQTVLQAVALVQVHQIQEVHQTQAARHLLTQLHIR